MVSLCIFSVCEPIVKKIGKQRSELRREKMLFGRKKRRQNKLTEAEYPEDGGSYL